MKSLSSALVVASVLSLATAVPALAASLPSIKTSASNPVPECATPGRMMALIAERNGNLDSRFKDIAVHYMRHGEELGIRWDYAFYQMMLETGNLSFKNGNRPGSVKPTQNNFAGLGATGGKEPGESFKDVASGVKAHLQHLLMYSGEHIDDPVADRTRKVQEWGVLTSWHKGFKRPITFADLAAKWAPGSHGYGRDIESIASNFKDDFCDKPDPKPQLVQEARAGRVVAKAEADEGSEKISGKALARQAMERARAEGDATRSSLGATLPSAPAATTEAKPAQTATPGLKILNNESPEVADSAPATSKPQVQTVAAGATAKTAAANPPKTPPAQPPASQHQASKCRVWTASYGGQKSVIIRSPGDQLTNYTVLDVNEGQEARETEAYISAYAKGGQKIGDFANQNTALDKAFQLCPEG